MPERQDVAPRVSIIVCTCDRAESLTRLLTSLQRQQIPGELLPVELVLVDNGEAANRVVSMLPSELGPLDVRTIREPRRGKSYALNTGIRAARGEFLLFTDDDVEVPAEWVARMASPLIGGRGEVIVGGVKIAEELQRPWMRQLHRIWLASTEHLHPAQPPSLVGANMAVHRRVFTKVAGFDTELGPGAIGLGEETLFAEALKAAGITLTGALDVTVTHHFDVSRLRADSFRQIAVKAGESEAYIDYHWHHTRVRYAVLRRWIAELGSLLRHLGGTLSDDSPPGEPELRFLHRLAYLRRYCDEVARPRRYRRKGGGQDARRIADVQMSTTQVSHGP